MESKASSLRNAGEIPPGVARASWSKLSRSTVSTSPGVALRLRAYALESSGIRNRAIILIMTETTFVHSWLYPTTQAALNA